jgi:hypothetical protein
MNGEGSDSVAIPLSRGYTLLFIVLALVMDPFVFFGMLALSTTGIVGTVIALIGSALAAVVTLQLVIQFLMPSWFGLRLDPQGFTVRMNLGSRRYRWVEVEQFFLYHTVALYPVVVFKYRGKAEVSRSPVHAGTLGDVRWELAPKPSRTRSRAARFNGAVEVAQGANGRHPIAATARPSGFQDCHLLTGSQSCRRLIGLPTVKGWFAFRPSGPVAGPKVGGGPVVSIQRMRTFRYRTWA